jgi:hypothetical protein
MSQGPVAKEPTALDDYHAKSAYRVRPTAKTAATPVRPPADCDEFGAGLPDFEDAGPELADVLETDAADAEPVTVGSH